MLNEETEDVYYNGMKTESKTQALRDFHNLICKKTINRCCIIETT